MTVGRHLVAQRGLVDALVEPHAGAVVIVVVVVLSAVSATVFMLCDVDRDVFAEIGQRGDGFDGGVVGDDHAVGLQPRAGGRTGRRHQDAQLLAFLQAAVAAAGAERRGDRLRLFRRRALVAQDRGDGVALLDHMDAFAGRIAAGDLVLGLRQQRDVFRHHAGFEAGIGIGGGALGGIGHLEVGLRAAGVGRGIGQRGVAHAAALPRQFEASRTRIRTSSSATTAAIFAFGRIGARSLVTKETSASGSAASAIVRIVGGGGRRRRRHRSACAGR